MSRIIFLFLVMMNAGAAIHANRYINFFFNDSKKELLVKKMLIVQRGISAVSEVMNFLDKERKELQVIPQKRKKGFWKNLFGRRSRRIVPINFNSMDKRLSWKRVRKTFRYIEKCIIYTANHDPLLLSEDRGFGRVLLDVVTRYRMTLCSQSRDGTPPTYRITLRTLLNLWESFETIAFRIWGKEVDLAGTFVGENGEEFFFSDIVDKEELRGWLLGIDQDFRASVDSLEELASLSESGVENYDLIDFELKKLFGTIVLCQYCLREGRKIDRKQWCEKVL